MKPNQFKITAPPIFRWLLFALIFLSQVPVYAAAPTFTATYPKIDPADTKHNSLELKVQTNETGKAYYVVLADGATAPSDVQVKAGQDDQGNAVDADKKGVLTLTADTEASSYVIGLTANTAYDIYVVAEDSAANLNNSFVGDVTTAAAPTDVTPPVFDDLGNPITAGETTIEFTVKTDEAGTAHYVVLDDNATVPTDAQIKNGQDDTSTDVDANKKRDLTLTANTGSIASITGLIANTAYDIYVIAEDAEGNVATGKIDVLTLADTTAPEFATDYPKVESITETSADLKVQSNEAGKAYYVNLAAGAAAPTDVKTDGVEVTFTADTEVSDTISSLTAGTTYDLYIMIEDDAGNVTTTAASYPLNFTTTAGPDGTGDITGDYDNAGKTITAGTDSITGTTTITGGTLSGTFDFTTSGLDVTLNNVVLAASASINGGRLEGTITGDATNPATLTNVTIAANAELTNVIIGDGVTFEPGVILENVQFTGANISLSDVTLKGTITIVQTSITVFTNVEFGIGFTALSGGTLSGIIRTATGFSGSASLTGLILLDVTEFTTVDISITDVTFQGSFTTTSTTVVFTNVIFGLNFTAFSGGTLSGTIATATGFSGSASLTGLTLLNVASFTIVNVFVTNVTLQGTFTTTSTVTLTNVTLGANVVVTGTGVSLAGTIQPITPTTVVNLTNLNIAANSIVLKGVNLDSSVTQGAGVQTITQTLTIITGTITGTQTNVSIPAGATITGGTLAGAIIGNALNPPTLNVTSISAGAILSNVILGANVATLPLNITLGVGVQFTSLSILPVGFNLTSILPVFIPPPIIGVTLPPIISLNISIIVGGPTLFSAITPVSTVSVFGSGARIRLRKGRLKVNLQPKPNKRPAMCGFRPSRAGSGGGRRRSLRASTGNEYGFGNALYLTADGVEILNQPSVQNLESLKAKLVDEMGYSNFTVKDNGNISVEKDGKTINFRPSITSNEVDASTPLGFKDNKSFEDGLVTFIFDDVDEEDGTTRREQVLYPAPASLEDITDDKVVKILTKNDQDGGSYKEDGVIKFEVDSKTYEGTLDYYVEAGASSRAAGITVTNNSGYFLITYTDGTKQKLFKVPGSDTDPVITPPAQQQPDGSTTIPVEPTLTPIDGPVTNTGILENISLSENAVIDGGILQGKIVGSANGFAKLDNLEIVANTFVSNVSLGKGVTLGSGVTLKDVLLMGASLSNVTLEGTIRTASSGTTIKDVLLGANAKLIGGKLAGSIKGDSTAPALLEYLTIEANSQLSYVIISDGVDFAPEASLGKGVKFSKAENIPFNIDLTGTLPNFANTIAVDLSVNIIVDGKGLLVNINNLPAFADNGFKIDQSDKSGILQLTVEGLTFAVTPIKVKRVDSNTRAADQSLRLGFGNSVYFKTDDGIEVESHPAVQDLATLEALLAAIEIPKIEITKEGNIKVPVTDKLWFSGRAALASEAAEAEVGFTFKGDLVVLVFEDKDGQKRQQVLYPAPASNATVIQLAKDASLTEEGILSFKFGETAYKGKLDYSVENGEATENSGITEIADSNGDGLPDFLMTYPQGDKQKLFALPPAEEK